MSDSLRLVKVEGEFRPLLLKGDRQAVGSAVSGWVEFGLAARVVRGRKMRTVSGLFDEFAAAFQFPLYFGENWSAFDECIADLETLPAAGGYVVVIVEPEQVLAEAGADELGLLVDSLESAALGWGQPVELGEWWDRPGIPFHVVLAGEPDAIELAARRWAEAGVEPLPYEQE